MELGARSVRPAVAVPGPGGVLTRARTLAAYLLLPSLTAVLAYGAAGHGAFSPERGAVVAVVLATLALLSGAASLRHARPFAIGFASLAVGLFTGTAVHGWPTDAIVPALTLTTAVGSFLVARELVRRGERENLLHSIAWTGGIVAVLGIAAVAVHAYPWAGLATGLWRLSSTMSYANAAASLLALCVPAALLLLRERDVALRRAVVFLSVLGLLLTLSRGAMLALVVALPVTLLLGGWAGLRSGVRPILGSLVAFLGALPSVTAATGRPVPLLIGVIGGGMIGVAPVPVGRLAALRRLVRRHRAALVILAGMAVILVGAFALGRDGLGRLSASRIDLAGEGRWENWSTQLAASLDVPLLGNGFRVYPPTEANRYAHNEYLQVFHDSGVVGLGSVVLAIGAFVVGISRARPSGSERVVWAIAVGACAVFAIQSAVDFLWRFPVLVLLAFAWLAVAATVQDEREEAHD